ncbi:PAS domain S-box-containing protein/diguanylate cyclase (GGDEF)-like protein [Neobacillus bataviensis]|uniref:PAS domain S-box-containing protein/diguanylate cyclase (GGDEF)-like protein n=1 Tax=Neobacillus bataviensis TaxID=220685 RepID=A0A561DEP5_9BACI|nr:bifunctional diguanylate cyclase/phosphodiesterase [Neobacillus bataviensis]TWE01823.1 PAS domain S-box-containing protein/diguanylate cyclase (GGDEF)-like protein [Neobacillus bataviensis]
MNVQSIQQAIELEKLRSQVAELERQNKKLSKQIRVNESLYLSILDALPINIFLEDPEGRTIYANKQVCLSNGVSLDKIVGKTIFDYFPLEIAKLNRAYDLEVWKKRQLITREFPSGYKGEEHHMFSGKTIIHIDESDEDFLLGFALEITDRVRAENRLKESEEKFRSLTEQAADSFFLIGTDGMFTEVNPTACEVLNFSKEELLRMSTEMVFSKLPEKIKHLKIDSKEQASSNFEDLMTGKDDTQIPVDINIRLIHIGENQMYFALCRDIRDKKRAEAQIKHMAFHDALTDLPNRWAIQSIIEEHITQKNVPSSILGFILLDLDYFKVVNDSLGHEAGDLLLKEVSKRLQDATDHREVKLARFGGDEFIILIPQLSSEKEITEICDRIMEVMAAPFLIKGQRLNISTSMGISFYPKDGTDLNSLIKNADLAMYGSKELGRSCYSLYHPDMKHHANKRMDLEILLRKALDENEFILYYQPKVNLHTGEINGMEALIRWKNKLDQIILPDAFIPIAEETGLINPIGEWVLREACRQCKEWQDLGFGDLTISVNLSPKQFQRQNLVGMIISVLEETGLSPNSLELEVTEGIVMKNPEEAVIVLQELKQLGIKISIDDFGTGFSSLSYLKFFPIDILKIDRSFIANIERDDADAKITSAVISLAHSLKINVVAEGVENGEQYDFLVNRSCDYAQGNFISKPVDPKEVKSLLVYDEAFIIT